MAPVAPDRMAERNRAAIRVDLFGRQPKLLVDGAGLSGKGFVGFNHGKVTGRNACPFHGDLHGRNRADAHDRRVDPGNAVGADFCQRLDTKISRLARRHQNERGCAVIETGSVASCYQTILFEHGTKLGHALQAGVVADVLVGVENLFLASAAKWSGERSGP